MNEGAPTLGFLVSRIPAVRYIFFITVRSKNLPAIKKDATSIGAMSQHSAFLEAIYFAT